MAKKKIPSGIEITELMLVKAGDDFTRTFIGEIYRETNIDGNPIVRGKVVVNEGKIWAAGETQEELRRYLDDICTMKLDMDLHSDIGLTYKIFGEDFFLN
jgi:hypothetical protein